MSHEHYMKMALELSLKGWGLTKNNPLVGAVVVKDGQVISEGFHEYFGGPHAEALALENMNTEGATLYCTLEPCCHTNKKTPPCLPLILKKKVSTVVIAMKDPNPEVSGKSINALEKAGIKVITGVLEDEACRINLPFITNMVQKKPFIHVKIAQTLDGKMVLANGVSQWITGEEARKNVHYYRSRCDAILIGGKTYKNDNPSLNVRDLPITKNQYFTQPEKIVVSRSPVKDQREGFIFVEHEIRDWEQYFNELYQRGLYSVYIEAGPNLASQFISNNLFDALSIYVAPKIAISGKGLEGRVLKNFDESLTLNNYQLEKFENGDICYHFYKE